MKWRFFFGASMIAGYGIWRAGAPLAAILMGIVLAGILNMTKLRRQPRLLK